MKLADAKARVGNLKENAARVADAIDWAFHAPEVEDVLGNVDEAIEETKKLLTHLEAISKLDIEA